MFLEPLSKKRKKNLDELGNETGVPLMKEIVEPGWTRSGTKIAVVVEVEVGAVVAVAVVDEEASKMTVVVELEIVAGEVVEALDVVSLGLHPLDEDRPLHHLPPAHAHPLEDIVHLLVEGLLPDRDLLRLRVDPSSVVHPPALSPGRLPLLVAGTDHTL